MNNQEVSTAYVGSTEIKECRLGSQLVLAPNGDALWYKANEVPTLDLRFAENESLVDATTGQNLVTFTRASEATFVNSQGQIQTAAINAPRFDHNPVTGESLGLLVEEQRTNSIRNNTMVGAVAGTPGTLPTNWAYVVAGTGITREIVGTGTENGINYIDIRFSGTSGSTTVVTYGIDRGAALTGQSWTASLYWKLVAGSTANTTGWTIGLIEETSTSTFVAGAYYAVSTPTATLARVAASRTLSGGATVANCLMAAQVTCTNGAAIDITLRIGMPQLEQGAFATSVIPTTASAVTRSADVATIAGTNFSSWFRQDESTVFVDCAVLEGSAFITSATRTTFDITDGTASNRLSVRAILNAQLTDQITVRVGGSSAINLTTGVTVSSSPRKIAAAFRANDTAAAGTGATSVATADTGPMPIGLNQANIGSIVALTNQTILSGTIARIAYWPARLGNEVLQSIIQ